MSYGVNIPVFQVTCLPYVCTVNMTIMRFAAVKVDQRFFSLYYLNFITKNRYTNIL